MNSHGPSNFYHRLFKLSINRYWLTQCKKPSLSRKTERKIVEKRKRNAATAFLFDLPRLFSYWNCELLNQIPARLIFFDRSISNYRSKLEVNPVVTRRQVYGLSVVYAGFSTVVVVVPEEISCVDRATLIHISPGPYLDLCE